tara:strand:+ start:4533 stop:5378 length:846 start_codon:yes stop_codon:yes gene_type:complete
MIEYDTVIISGGASKGIAALGVLQAASDRQMLNNVKRYIGTSIGSIISYLICIEYTPIELMINFYQSSVLEDLNIFDIGNIITGAGATKWSILQNFLEKLTLDKVGEFLTLKNIYERYNKILVCCTYNKTKRCKEYLDYQNNPDLPCLIALRMSSNLPLLFDRFKYRNCYYIDGGIADHFPIHKVKDGEYTLAINLKNNYKNRLDGEFNILEYIYDIICIPIEESVQNRKKMIENMSNKCTIVEIRISNTKIFNFNINNKDQLNLFSLGYQECKKSLENII